MVVTLLTRAGCPACARALAELEPLCSEHAAQLSVVDVDEAAVDDPELLPVVLLDGVEHSYGEVDEARLRADLRPR